MKKYHCYSADFDKETERLFKEAEFLGQGNNGVVYSLPENKVIKLFFEEKVWHDEYDTLLKVKDSEYFPKVYKGDRLYIVREKVNGIQLDKYIKSNGISREIVSNIYKLINEFERLDFAKIDTRCKDLYIVSPEKIMVIDPKKCYRRNINFPRHLMKGLLKYGVLDEFIYFMDNIDKEKCKLWQEEFKKYWKKEKRKKRHKNYEY